MSIRKIGVIDWPDRDKPDGGGAPAGGNVNIDSPPWPDVWAKDAGDASAVQKAATAQNQFTA